MEPDVGSLKVYGPLGLFCAALIAGIIVLWQTLGKKDHVISGFITTHMANVKEHQGLVFEMMKAQREQVDRIVKDGREELIKLSKEHKEEMEAMVDRVVESNHEHAKELRAILDRQLTMAESLDRKLDVRR